MMWLKLRTLLQSLATLQCCGSGSGAFLTPGSGNRNGFFPNPGSQTHIFESLLTIFWVKSSIILFKKFLQHFKNKIIFNFVKFVATKKGMTTNFFAPLSFVLSLDPGSEIQDPRSGFRDPVSGIRDPGSGMDKNQDPG